MTKRIRVLTAILAAVLCCGLTLAQEPVVNIDKSKHSNLAEAQRLVAEANRYIVDAQKVNKSQMGGHATKARQLLVQANQELKAAAEVLDAAGATKNYHGVLAPEWQKKYDSYYQRWLKYRATNNTSEMASMEARMRDIMTHYNIPPNIPFDQVASPGK
jgi:hypothetical protein